MSLSSTPPQCNTSVQHQNPHFNLKNPSVQHKIPLSSTPKTPQHNPELRGFGC